MNAIQSDRSAAHAARGAVCAIAAAALFGVSTPIAKLLVPNIHPLMFAGLLYFGAAGALTLAARLRPRSEAQLRWGDAPRLSAIILTGGILGPSLMLIGLTRMSAVAASLLLNLEAPFTILVAVLLFGESLARKEAMAAAFLVCGALFLAWAPGEISGSRIGLLAIAGACLGWAFDNNLTQALSHRDPIALVRWKAAGAAAGNLLLAWLAGAPMPAPGVIPVAVILGAASYGASVVCAIYALRWIGAARESAYFATAPFFGAVMAMLLLGERLGWQEGAAAILMIAGIGLLLRERHSHQHLHEALRHDHAHVHDPHHQHPHEIGIAATEPHTHEHHHAPLSHAHAHLPDIHHRHRH